MNTKHWQAGIALALAVFTGAQAVAEELATLKADRVNVRGEAALNGDVITQLRKGEKVTVLEEITVEKPKPGEPAKWARILLPSNTPVWIHTLFLDPETKTVKANRLNVRSGPGENFSILCRLEQGATVKEIRTVGHWMEIEPPATASAYVAAEFLEKTASPAAPESPAKPADMTLAESKPAPKPVESAEKPVVKPPAAPAPAKAPEPISTVETVKVEPPPAPTVDTIPSSAMVKPAPVKAPEVEAPSSVAKAPATVAPPPPVEPPPAPVKPAPALPAPLVSPPPVIAPAPAEVASPASTEPPPRRVVTREGVVKRAWSIQSPTSYVLADAQTGKTINYLYTEDSGLQLKYYVGQKILISGEEKLDPRWPATPLITVKTLENLR